MIQISDRVAIPEEELRFTASLSGGPGGQNVNKVSTRITLWFDVVNSPRLTDEDKELIMSRLGSRIGKDGMLRVISQETRSQLANREAAIERFVELMQAALRRLPARKKTRISRAAKERRLGEKKHRARLKSRRSERVPVED